MTVEEIARALGNPEQEGRSWRCICPLHGGHSLILSDTATGLRIKCWAGCDTKAIRVELRRRKLYTPGKGNGAAKPETRAEHENRVNAIKAKRKTKTKDAQWYWDNSAPAANTMAEVYFASRLILAPPPPTLRLCPSVWRPKAKINQPHIIGLIEHETDGVIGAHFVALNPLDASVRVTGEDRKWSKGHVKGGAVRLYPAGPVLALAEGIEDAMTFTEATGTPAWAAISGDGIRNFVPPPLATTQIILLVEDQDENQVGQRAVAGACLRLAALGYKVAIVRPKVGKDLNDALLMLGPGTELFTIDEYEPNRAGDWYGKCAMGDGGKPLSNFSNAVLALRDDHGWQGVLGYDEMAGEVTLLRPLPGTRNNGRSRGPYPRRLEDLDISHAQEWLQWGGLPLIGRDPTHKAIETVASDHRYHPVRDWLDGLKWDGTKRLDDWLTDCLGVEKTEYAMAIGRMFLIAMAARVYEPGCPANYILILEGKQGTGKSTACRTLGDPYFSDNLPGDLGSRDALLHLRGHWLIEISELHAFSRSQLETLKAFVTRQIDIYRPVYGRVDVHQPRQSMLIGTSNSYVYLTDPTGSRRSWPVRTGVVDRIDIDTLRTIRDQLFAEALVRYRGGEKWWPDQAFEQQHIVPEQEQRFEEDAWEDPIAEYLATRLRATIYHIAREALSITTDRIGTADQRRIRAILQRLAFRRGGGSQGRVQWVRE